MVRLGLALGVAVLLSACGSSSEDDSAPSSGGAAGAAGQAGSGGAEGAAGAGGVAGAAGVGGAAGTAGAAGAGGVGGEIDFDPNAITEAASDFPAGIQSGDALSDAAMIWTLYAGSAPLRARVYRPTSLGKAKIYFDETVTPTADGFVHVDAGGLPDYTELFYVFLEEGAGSFAARSPIGRLVTAPLPGKKPVVRFGGTSCTKNDRAPFETLPQAAKQKLDFFILGGDTTYNDSASSLEEYRALWQKQIGDPSYRSLFSSTGHFATWDDHEVDNNWNPETFDTTRLANATQAFFEHLAIRRNATEPNRVWRSFAWGDTLEVFVLDSRSERKPSTKNSAYAQYLSPAQLSWLEQGLKDSTATFKIIVNSVPITNFPLLFDVEAGDRWEGYPAQRKALLDFITDTPIPGVLFVSGDFHLASVGRVEETGKWATLREVLMGPGDNGPNPLWLSLPGGQFDYKSGTSNVTLFEANPDTVPPTIKVTFVDGDGKQLWQKTYEL